MNCDVLHASLSRVQVCANQMQQAHKQGLALIFQTDMLTEATMPASLQMISVCCNVTLFASAISSAEPA